MRISVILLLSLFISIVGFSAIKTSLAQDQKDEGLLPKEVFAKFKGMQEDVTDKMKKREASMSKILVAIPGGDFAIIKTEADKIGDEYSIEFGWDPEVVAEYDSLIMSDFVFYEQDLFQYAAGLGGYAEEKDLEGTLAQFDLLLRSCVDCHYNFAGERFPSLAGAVVE